MAIFHLSVKAVQRSKGRSAVAAAAYRSGEKMLDERQKLEHDYTRKQGIEHTEIITPTGEAVSREQLWNFAEAAENRKDGTTAKEYELALPSELTAGERQELAAEFGKYLAERHGCAVDIAIHAPHRQGAGENHHAHILTTTRIFEHGALGAKCDKELSDRDRKKKGLEGRKVEVSHARETWAALVNSALERGGHEARVDHRTLEAQGVDRIAQIHMGVAATAMERRGIQTERGDINRAIASVSRLKAEIAQLEQEPPRAQENQAEKPSRDSHQELLERLGVSTLSSKEVGEKTNAARSDLAKHIEAQGKWQNILEKNEQALAKQGKITRWLEGKLFDNAPAERVAQAQEALKTLGEGIEGLKTKIAELDKAEAILQHREAVERQKQVEEQRRQEQEKGQAFERRIENANNTNEYRAILREFAAQHTPNRVDRYYDQWAEPYMETIKSAGADHKKAFQQCVELAKRDVTTDKGTLQKMESRLHTAMRGMPGTGGQHAEQVREMMNVIRLHDNRAEGFERVAGAFLKQVEQAKDKYRGR